MKIAWDTMLLIVFVPTMLGAVLLRWGTAFPRIGCWLDRKVHSLFPRVGHLFVEDSQREDDERS